MKQRGFSLPEVLCALMLFMMVILLFLNYHHWLQQRFETQWQTQQLWRYTLEQTESGSPLLPPPWQTTRQQTSCGECLCIHVTITCPGGRTGQLSKLICPSFNLNPE
ncbi:prepilin-type N-terminal cleavage/methylation domain-containing protein [Citrobacter sp. JGM124]|uniref:prepilin-type N-terminal cleavage/methylation domain-containing protein n=1 Tax=Citrobacter sp. JGM124 TaxID=2799789 RepID=UPI0020128487|nr:prepilin-type N-terminal cleavage/methylation domain-containing protein [Citrobacter sp. JGM124]